MALCDIILYYIILYYIILYKNKNKNKNKKIIPIQLFIFFILTYLTSNNVTISDSEISNNT